jgi:inhibitor of KinA
MRIARALLRAGAGAGPKRGLPRLGPRLFSTFSRPEVVAAGEGAVVIRFGTSIDTDVNKAALRLAKQLDREACVLECVPAYASVLVRYDPLRTPPTEMTALCQKLASLPPGAETDEGPGRLVRLNVAYGGAELGPDLANVAVLTGITEEEV